jgi:hypothetical protein
MEENDLAGVTPDPIVKELYGSYRQYLNHEHGLINHRLSWNFTIQGFLFTSYAFVLNKAADVRIALSQEAMVGVNQLRAALHDLQVLLLVVAVVGVCASVAIHLSVWGARLSMKELRLRWSKLKYTDGKTLEQVSLSSGYPAIMGGGDPDATKLGFYAPAILSMALAIAWLLLILDGLWNH